MTRGGSERLGEGGRRGTTWDDVADAWVKFVRGGLDYYREYLNTPAMLRLIGPVKGLDVLDLGCGEGYHARIFARRGARVTAVDQSNRLIEYALDEERKLRQGVRYIVADASDLSMLDDRSLDLVASFMAMMDITDYRRAIREVSRVLRPGGRFVFSITHPCFDVLYDKGRMVSGWVMRRGAKAKTSANALYFRVDNYFSTGIYEFSWKMRHLEKPFVTQGWHLTLGDYFRELGRAGLLVRNLIEPQPTAKGLKVWPPLERVKRVPQSAIFECVKVRLV